MGNSLQEQLLKAGLVDKNKANKAKKQQGKKARQQRNAKGAPLSAEALQRQQEQATRAARDRELNQQREEKRKQREIAAQVKQLVETNRHPRKESEEDLPFNFENKGKIKKIHVSPEAHKLISSGRLMIVNCNGLWELVPTDVAEKIRERNPSLVIDLPKEETPAEDDPYAEFQVPDDLMW